MNKKLIIAAVSAAIVAPVVSYADTTAYGRARGVIQSGESATDVNSDIRFGLKASGDIGNGLNAHAKVEMTVNPDSTDNLTGKNITRVAKAGLSGEFGTIQIGQMWSAYYAFGTMISLSNHGNSIGSGILRQPNTVKYSNTFGPVSLAIDARFNDGEDSGSTSDSGLGIGLTLNPIDALTIGIATDTAKGAPVRKGSLHKYVNLDGTDADTMGGTGANKDDPIAFNPELHRTTANPVAARAAKGDDTKRTGIAARYTLGSGLWGTIGIQSQETGEAELDDQYLWLGGPITANTKWLLGKYTRENKAGNENEETSWGVYHSVGGGLTIYYEGFKQDNFGEAATDTNTVGMVFGF